MISEKKLKHNTQLIIISVLVLVLITLGVSYSAFFSVQSQTTVQKFKTGELSVVIDGSAIIDELFPTLDNELPQEAVPSDPNYEPPGKFATLILTNEGNLDADFSVTIGYDYNTNDLPENKANADFVPLEYLNIGIFDVNNGKWIAFGSDYYISINSLRSSTENESVYPILRDQVPAPSSSNLKQHIKEYHIFIWLDEKIPTDQIGNLVNLKLDVKSTTVNGRIE